MPKIACLLLLSALFCAAAEPPRAPAVEVTPRAGIGHFMRKVRAGRPVTVAYFGGSITAQGDSRTGKGGWRVKTTAWLRRAFPQAKITEVHAAIGGTDSQLGVFRCAHDVLAHNPDLVFVEFACNDGGDRANPARAQQAMEGIVRQTWRHDPETDIVFTYTITAPMTNAYLRGLRPVAATAHDALAAHYGIPSVDFGPRVAKRLAANELVMDPKACVETAVPKGDPKFDAMVRAALKNDRRILFANDGVHPRDEGHDFYLASIQEGFRAWADLPPADHAAALARAPLRKDNLEDAKMVPLARDLVAGDSWKPLPDANPIQGAFRGRATQIWEATAPGDALRFRFRGRVCKLYDLLGPDCGQVWITVDGVRRRAPVPRFDSYCTYYRLAALEVYDGAWGDHTVEIAIDRDQPSRQSVAFRLKDPARELASPAYNGTRFLVGQIMLVGDLVRPKQAGFAMRLDDNHAPEQWRQVAKCFADEGLRVSFAVTAATLSDAQGQCLAELAARGHEIMDHTPQHAMYAMRLPDASAFDALKDAPFAAEAKRETLTLLCRPELDFAHPSAFTFRAAIRGGELVDVEPADAVKRLTFSRKFFDRATGRGWGVSRLEGARRFVLDFWRRPAADVPATTFVSLDQAAITPSAALRRAQADLTRRHFERFALPRPTMWIQPGGWEAFLDYRRLKEVYGDVYGYQGADAVVGGSPWNGCFNDPDPVRGRWSFKPVFFYFDEGATLAQVKKQVADSVAKGRSFIFISHMNARRLKGGWEEWLASTRAFARWLNAAKIPVYTLSALNRRVFDTTLDATANVFPSFACDRDGDGVADGVRLAGGARCDCAQGTVALDRGQSASVDGFCGLERGASRLAFTARGKPGTVVHVQFHQSDRGGSFASLRRAFTLGPDGTAACTLDVSIQDACVGATATFSADGPCTLSSPTFTSLLPKS